jgi:hypothetical protein
MCYPVALMILLAMAAAAADAPSAEIANGKVRVRVYLPDSANGFYQGTRFDWSGVIAELAAEGHRYYGPWFSTRNPAVRDFVYDGEQIVAGACSSTMGPADEFRVIGFEDAKPGGTFVKIGVGALRRPDGAAYDAYRLYPVADTGKWTVRRKADSIAFTQTLTDAGSGIGYVYTKTLQLVKGKSEMMMIHSLKNTGKQAIGTTVYNHNFLIVDGKGPEAGTTITVPFAIRTPRPPNGELAGISGSQIVYKKTLAGKDVVSCPVEGFGQGPADHEFRIENASWKAGVSVRGDQPLQRINLWSIRSNVSLEPFIAVTAAPGKVFTWTNTYRYYALP